MTKHWQQIAIVTTIVSIMTPSWALPTANSVGSAGIDALKLHQDPYNLTGKKIAIGQVEVGRPAQFGWDKAAQQPKFKLEQIFYQNGLAKANTHVEQHATMVASVMISGDKRYPGVAPAARLYASAVGLPRVAGQEEECLSTQHVASQNGGDVRAINLSFGEPLDRDPRVGAKLDGNALFTQCLDWSARVHNVMFSVAGNQGKGGISIPTDNYNGINVAYSTLRQGIYRKLDFANLSEAPIGTAKSIESREINVGNRRSIGLVAPGGNLRLYNLAGKATLVNGTSFAAPHVTGTVALLQEFGDRQLRQKQQLPISVRPHWSLDARRHQVMKAVLLNSADKIQDAGDGLRLGMTRTLLSKNNRDWTESAVDRDRQIPLDYQLGAGQLNAFRAYQQFSPGQYSEALPVPAIGWDYRAVNTGEYRDYFLDRPVVENSWVSITLAWDRLVELRDTNGNGEYDLGDQKPVEVITCTVSLGARVIPSTIVSGSSDASIPNSGPASGFYHAFIVVKQSNESTGNVYHAFSVEGKLSGRVNKWDNSDTTGDFKLGQRSDALKVEAELNVPCDDIKSNFDKTLQAINAKQLDYKNFAFGGGSNNSNAFAYTLLTAWSPAIKSTLETRAYKKGFDLSGKTPSWGYFLPYR